MKIETQNQHDITALLLQGELSSEVANTLQESARNAIAAGATGIVIDMENITFIDSVGLETLLWLRDYCQENNRQFKISALDENCKTIMEITRLADQLDSYSEITEAVKSFV